MLALRSAFQGILHEEGELAALREPPALARCADDPEHGLFPETMEDVAGRYLGQYTTLVSALLA